MIKNYENNPKETVCAYNVCTTVKGDAAIIIRAIVVSLVLILAGVAIYKATK